MESVHSPRYYELFIEPKNVKVNNNNKNCKGALPLICKLHIQWGLFHIIKVIVVKYNTAEINESLIFLHNAAYLLEGIHLCIKRQTVITIWQLLLSRYSCEGSVMHQNYFCFISLLIFNSKNEYAHCTSFWLYRHQTYSFYPQILITCFMYFKEAPLVN